MTKGLLERLKANEPVLVAEGYLLELEKRGYLQAGAFVPEVVLEHPHLVQNLHEEFVHAGSDVVEAFTYYGHREKLRLIGREDDLEPLNRKALKMARDVANRTGTLMAGNVCNTTAYDPNDPSSPANVFSMFKEQIEWAVEEGADYIVGETFTDVGEAKLALEAIKKHGNGLPAVITFAQVVSGKTRDGFSLADACKILEDEGASVVGLNCTSGPEIMLELMRDVRAKCSGPIAAIPVPLRTTKKEPQMQTLTLPNGERAFPRNMDYFYCTQDDMFEFGKKCQEMGILYVGICCGNTARHFRRLAESFGRQPPACRYTTDMSKHYTFGNHPSLKAANTTTLKGMQLK